MVVEVEVSTSLNPNILMHVFSCLEIDGTYYSSNYGAKHHFTLEKKVYQEWEGLLKKIQTLGIQDVLYSVLFQIPSYIPAEDIEILNDYFDALQETINKQSMDILLDSYPSVFDNLEYFIPITFIEDHFNRLFAEKTLIIQLIQKLRSTMTKLWKNFYEDYWTKEALPELEKQSLKLNKIIKPVNLVNSWQKKLLIDYPYSEFTIYLVEPTTTISTDLLAEKIIISNSLDERDIYRIIIHEVGRSYLLTNELFVNSYTSTIAKSNIDKLSLIVDAICLHFKKELFIELGLRDQNNDPYLQTGLDEIVKTFNSVWSKMEEKNIYNAIAKTYNALSPVV